MAELNYDYYSSVQEKDVEWLWHPYIPYGKLTLLQGDPGEGKSTFILNVIALLTNGKNMPDGYTNNVKQTVIYQSSEDSANDTIKPRLMAAGADCTKVAFIRETDDVLTLDDKRIEDVIAATGARLFVLDPFQSFCGQDGDINSIGKMRTMLRKLAEVAERNRCAVVLVGHRNKKQSSKSLYRGMGSIDIAAILRSVLVVERDADDPALRYMYQIKSSLAAEGKAMSFCFDAKTGFKWIGPCDYAHDYNFDELKENKLEVAKREIKSLLKNGAVSSSAIFEHMDNRGIAKRTVNKAKGMMRIKSVKKGDKWFWVLPES